MMAPADIMVVLASALGLVAAASWIGLPCRKRVQHGDAHRAARIDDRTEIASQLLVMALIVSATAAFFAVAERFIP